MARLDVVAAARWAGSGDFHIFPILVAVSVSDGAGLPVQGLPDSAFHVRYQHDPDNSFAGAVSAFHEHGGEPSGHGEYSFVVKPGGESPPFAQDEVFLYVTVSRGGNHGQTLCLAKFHVFG
jgi:hypothetical protein